MVAPTAGLAGCAALGTRPNPYYSGPPSDHFDGSHFFNPGSPDPTGFLDVLRWQSRRACDDWPSAWPSPPDRDAPPVRIDGAGLRISYVGHATFLVQTAGLNFLTDPVWSTRASPVGFAGPERINPAGIDFENLPRIDVVLLSHNHYDHLDLDTIERLHERDAPRVLTPLGNDTIVHDAVPGCRIEASDWGDTATIAPGVSVTLHPSHHWSARGMGDRYRALWGAFSVSTPAGSVYFAGDTGYATGAHFRAATAAHGPFDVALLPIGAYAPRWFMQYSHQTPEEAVRAMGDLGASQAIAYHWGTFRLTDEPLHEPVQRLRTALNASGLDAARFPAPRPGQALGGRFGEPLALASSTSVDGQ